MSKQLNTAATQPACWGEESGSSWCLRRRDTLLEAVCCATCGCRWLSRGVMEPAAVWMFRSGPFWRAISSQVWSEMVNDGVNKLIAIWRWGEDSPCGLKIYTVEFDSTVGMYLRSSSYDKRKKNIHILASTSITRCIN
jgi:hypothetical protein